MREPGIKDFIIWDTVNWSKAIYFWEKHVSLRDKSLNCLELGSNQGGLSLWLRSLGHKVTCSDIVFSKTKALDYHVRFGFNDISYEAIDATNIVYSDEFDIIVFKSMLGGASRGGKDENKKLVMEQIHKALKPGGVIFFAENLEASVMHRFFRRKFIKWGRDWNYLKYNETEELFSIFSNVNLITIGFFGTFGRNEAQRRLLGRIDTIFSFLMPRCFRYILIGIATK
jgi:2-polyprenyl-3-methyl-5-hydroxy-6-metoxy-1,4-benzoquinol methylase